MDQKSHFIKLFKEINKDDVELVGVKGTNLGEMVNLGFPVPNGFIVTSNAYYHFLKENKLDVKIKHLLSTANLDNLKSLYQISILIKRLIFDSPISNDLIKEVISAYQKIDETLVAVKASTTSNDITKVNFLGHPDTILNVKGDAVLLEKIKHGWASLFDSREIYYRYQQKIDHTKIGIALIIQKMVESETSGTMQTIDYENNDKTKIIIKSILGLGEELALGKVDPDVYKINKKEFKILDKKISNQKTLLKKVGIINKEIDLNAVKGKKQKISDQQIIEIANLGDKIEKHYYFPQDIEWAIEKNNIYIIQTLPITNIGITKKTSDNTSNHEVILKGIPVNPGIASGPIKVILSSKESEKIIPGDIVVTYITNPEFSQNLKKAGAIIIESHDKNSHSVVLAKEYGIPCITGASQATILLKNGVVVTVNGITGEIYKGGFTEVNKHKQIINDSKTATKLLVNLSDPELSEIVSRKNVDGVGILKGDDIIIKNNIHPKKLINEKRSEELVNKLSETISSICKNFESRPVIYQISNLTTLDYKNLEGGKDLEPIETNPEIGFRGTFRHIHHQESLKIEIDAIKHVRNSMGLKNLWIMIPYARTPEELGAIKKIINKSGLERSSTFKIILSIDIPSNILMLEKFIQQGIDGISINSNLLMGLIMGTDKDNFEVSGEIKKINDAYLFAIEHAIKIANKANISTSIFNETNTSYTDLIKNLILLGISSICVSADSIDQARKNLIQAEKEFINSK